MKYKFLNFFKLFFCLVSLFTTFSLQAMDPSENLFDEGKEFRRTAAGSPIFIRFSNRINVDNYGISIVRPGFNIYLYDENPANQRHIGYVTVALREEKKTVDFGWVKVNPQDQSKGYATEALRTAASALRAHKAKFPWATHFFITVGKSVGPAMGRVAIKNGFTVSTRFFHPATMTDYEKLID